MRQVVMMSIIPGMAMRKDQVIVKWVFVGRPRAFVVGSLSFVLFLVMIAVTVMSS